MKIKIALLFLLISLKTNAQKTLNPLSYRQIYESRYVQIPPAFVAGPDSCRHYYFNHFKGFDSLLAMAIENGDTAKYLRVYFSFIVDRNGLVYDTRFIKIASTLYINSVGARTIHLFPGQNQYYEKMINEMLLLIPLWKPAMQDGVKVSSRVIDYLQCWIGLMKPPY
jgi:hypothetical protein